MVEDREKRVFIEYSITLDDGTLLASNIGREPVALEQGRRLFPVVVEQELIGLEVSESKHMKVGPEEAFGAVDPNAFVEVEPAVVPEEARKEGKSLVTSDPLGKGVYVRVHKVNKDSIVLDFNHPLAGESLNFHVTVISIESWQADTSG